MAECDAHLASATIRKGTTMKLRNKKTGEVADLSIFGIELNIRKENQPIYHSIAELNEEWEDCKPKEPYVEDEMTRKIIRAWADENDSTRVVYYSPKNELVDSYGNSISFNLIFRKLNHGAEYTIDELCGEKETPEPLEPSFIDLDERIKEKAAAEKLYKGKNDIHLAEEEE